MIDTVTWPWSCLYLEFSMWGFQAMTVSGHCNSRRLRSVEETQVPILHGVPEVGAGLWLSAWQRPLEKQEWRGPCFIDLVEASSSLGRRGAIPILCRGLRGVLFPSSVVLSLLVAPELVHSCGFIYVRRWAPQDAVTGERSSQSPGEDAAGSPWLDLCQAAWTPRPSESDPVSISWS